MSCLQYGSFCDTKVQKLNFDPTGRVDRSSCFSESASLVSTLLPTSMHLLVCLLFPVAPIDRLSRLLMRLPPIFKFTPKYRLPWHMTGRKSHQRFLQDLVNNSEHKDQFFSSLPQSPTNTSAVNSQVRNSRNMWRTTLSPTSNSLIPWPIPSRNAIAAGKNHSDDHTFHAVTTTTTYPSFNSETCVTTKSYSVVSARAAREQPSIHAESSTRSTELHCYSHSDSVSNLKSSLSAPVPATMFPHTSSHHCALNSTWIPYTLSSSTNQADSIVYIPCSRSAPSHSDVTCPGVYVDLTGYDVTVSVERLPPVSEVVTHPRAFTRRFNGPSVPTSSQHHSPSEISSGGVHQRTSGFTTEHGDHTASFLPSSPPPPYSECVFPTAPPIQHHYPFTNYWEYPTCRTGYIHPAHINPLVWSHPSCRPLSRSHSCSCYSCVSSTCAQMHSRTLSADRFVDLCCCCSVPPSGSPYNCPGPVYQAHTFVLAPKCDSLVVDHPVDLDWVYRVHSPPVNLSASHCGHFSASDIACVHRPSTSAAPPMNALPPSGYVYIPEPIRVMRSRDICNALRTCVVPHYELKNYFNNAPPQRQWRKLGELSKDGFPFTLMCYNLLSPNYATPTMYPYCPTWALNWDYRRRFILDEIRMYHANIICLQEVETNQFEEIFKPELEKLKYDAVFLPKSRRRTMDMKDCKKVDGCAIFWQTDKFEKLHEFHHEFMLSCSNMCENPTPLMLNRVMIRDNVALGVIFQTKGSSASDGIGGRQFCVTTGHIHWDPEHSDVKMIQTILWTSELWAYIDQYLTGSADNTERSSPTDSRNTPLSLRLPTPSPFSPAAHMPVILCGDLNSLPDSGVVEFLMRGSLPKTHTDFLNNGFKYMFEDWRLLEKWAVDGDILRHRFTFDRAYRESQGMRMTNYTYEFKGMIDYVLYSRDHFRLLGSLDQINESWFTERKILGCPHVHFPSDHFALLVELELKPTPQLNTLVAQKVARNRCCIEQLAQDHSRSGSDSSVDSTRLQPATADDSQGFDNSDGNSGAIGANSDGTGQSRQRKR
ncbi:unnamed protein product [Dicrocoelium dendriticum]|nr:unnamed protein product [Dicrocoelium dendriticum]